MDDKNQPQEIDKPTAPIIDVQPPQQNDAESSSQPTDTNGSSIPLSGSESQNVEASSVNPAESQSAAASEGEPEASHDIAQQPAPALPRKPGPPILAIVIAVIIAAILAVITVLAFGNKKTAVNPAPSSNQAASTPETQTITSQAVDETSTELDTTVDSVDETKDFPETELSDQSLGL